MCGLSTETIVEVCTWFVCVFSVLSGRFDGSPSAFHNYSILEFMVITRYCYLLYANSVFTSPCLIDMIYCVPVLHVLPRVTLLLVLLLVHPFNGLFQDNLGYAAPER